MFAQFTLIIFFTISCIIGPMPAQAELLLPRPGQMVALSPAFNPAVLKGIKLDPNNPLRFHFYVDQGDGDKSVIASEAKQSFKDESAKLIKYFLASLTIPEQDLWVNLSPYEKDRIIPQEFGQTEMGRDLLAQDYILKQITASLIYPESKLGKEFWQKIYTQAQAKYGTKNIPINTFNKVWIVPEKAVVYENGGTAFVLENHLKVMLEEDYLAQSKNNTMSSPNAFIGDPEFAKQIIREIVIPVLTKEINEGKNFAQLRQVFYSLILATWYKKKIKDSILNKVYANQKKVTNLSSPKSLVGDPEHIYQQYLQAFKKGVYNYIKEEPNPITGQTIPRKYFSGGVNALKMDQAIIAVTQVNDAQFKGLGNLTDALVDIQIDQSGRNTLAQRDRAMTVLTADVLTDEELLVQYLNEKNQDEFFILLDNLKKQSNEKAANSFTKLLIKAPYKTAFLIGLVLIDLDDADRDKIADQLLNEISDAKKVYEKLQSIRKGIPEIPANYKLILTVDGLMKIFHVIALFHQEEASIRIYFRAEIANQHPLTPIIIRDLLSLDSKKQAGGLEKVKLLGDIPEGIWQLIAVQAFFDTNPETRALAQKFLNDAVTQGRHGSKNTAIVLNAEQNGFQRAYTELGRGYLLRILRELDEFTGAVPDDLLIVLVNNLLPQNMEILENFYRAKDVIPPGMKDRVEYVSSDKLLAQQVASDFSFAHDINVRFARVLSYLNIPPDAQIMNFGSGTNMVKLSQWRHVLNVDITAYVFAAKRHAEFIKAQFSSQTGEDPYDVVLMHHWGMFGPPRTVKGDISFWQKTWRYVKPGGWLVLMTDPNNPVPWEMEKFLGQIQLANIPDLPAKVIMVPNDNQSTASMNPYMVIAIQKSSHVPMQPSDTQPINEFDGQGGMIGRWQFQGITYNNENGILIIKSPVRIAKKDGHIEEEFKNRTGDISLETTSLDNKQLNGNEGIPPERIVEINRLIADLNLNDVTFKVIKLDESAVRNRIYGIGRSEGDLRIIALREDILTRGTVEEIREALEHEQDELLGKGHVAIRLVQEDRGLRELIRSLSNQDKLQAGFYYEQMQYRNNLDLLMTVLKDKRSIFFNRGDAVELLKKGDFLEEEYTRILPDIIQVVLNKDIEWYTREDLIEFLLIARMKIGGSSDSIIIPVLLGLMKDVDSGVAQKSLDIMAKINPEWEHVIAVDIVFKNKINDSKALAEEKNINVVVQFPTNNVFIQNRNEVNTLEGDVIAELIANALKYTPEGGTITINLKQEGHEVIFSVQDTGIGIPESEKDNVWGYGHRAANAKEFEEGTGLGLSIMKEVVEKNYQGSVSFDSTEGEGSIFTVRIPVGVVPDPAMMHQKGGIDLNPAQMNMQVQNGSPIKAFGDDDDFKFSAIGGSAFGVDIDAAQVTGVSFTIHQMTPVTNLPAILGLPATNVGQ